MWFCFSFLVSRFWLGLISKYLLFNKKPETRNQKPNRKDIFCLRLFKKRHSLIVGSFFGL